MLNLKNARSLSRTDMKKLTGGTQSTNSGRPCLSEDCFFNGESFCTNGRQCLIYYCDPRHPENFGYKCQ
jgi:hypothetical protein